MATLIYSEAFLAHDTGRHPENKERLVNTRSYLAAHGFGSRWDEVGARAATNAELAAVHSPGYLAALEQLAAQGGGAIDPDTIYSAGTPLASRLAAGALLEGADRLLSGTDRSVFALVRPPGHHATPTHGMGFCIYNNVAVAARYLRNHHGLDRVAIVDFDVHHGNGTQYAFYDDPSVLYVSLHRFPFYPGTGKAGEQGEGDGLGATVNVPLAGGTPRERYLDEVRRVADDHLRPFRPQLLIFSAGFDAFHGDPIGGLGLEIADYHEITCLFLAACAESSGGRVLSALEGGYALDAIGPCVAAHLEALEEAAGPA